MRGARRFAAFCRQYVVVPDGKGALKPLRLRPWQIELVGSVRDPDPPTSPAGWMLRRGQGKSALVAGLGLYDLMLGADGASVVVVAADERQHGVITNREAAPRIREAVLPGVQDCLAVGCPSRPGRTEVGQVSNAQDLEYGRWHVVSAALSHVGEDIAYHRRRRPDWASDLDRALDQYLVIATGETPKPRADLQAAVYPLRDRIIRASLLFALADWRPTELAEWGPLPDPVQARRELNQALKAYVETARIPTAG